MSTTRVVRKITDYIFCTEREWERERESQVEVSEQTVSSTIIICMLSLPLKTSLPSSSLSFSSSNSSPQKMIVMGSLATTFFSQPSHMDASEVLPHCLFENCKSMEQLTQIHSKAIKTGIASNPVVQNRIVAFCCTSQNGAMDYARQVFDVIPEPSVFVWNTMIKGYSRLNHPEMGVSMYLDMLRMDIKPDCYTFPFLIKGFTPHMSSKYGKALHGQVVKFGLETNSSVQNALVHMYCLCGLIDMASIVFDMSSQADVVIWNAMISGYNRSKQYDKSILLFNRIEEKQVLLTPVTIVLVLSACSKLKDLESGKRVHRQVKESKIEPSLILENALIDMYAACGEMGTALDIFENMKEKDVISWTGIVSGFANLGKIELAHNYFDKMVQRDYVSWTVMIDGYIRLNRFKDALELFRGMQSSSVKPDEFTMVSILTACAHLGALELGEWIRTYIERNEIRNDAFVKNALIDMYFKCGNVDKARSLFKEISQRDKFTWTAMIVGLAINGHGEEALDMFSQMLKASIFPDEVTYVGVLTACTHTGMVDEGRKYFKNMKIQHGIKPNITHYGCIVDLLARAGHLKEAHEVIKNMPMPPNSIVWGALLGACRLHKEAEMAEMAAKQMLELEPENGAVYVLLCNIYAACKRLEKLRELRQIMMERGIKKTPGCSLIEMKGVVHEFVAGDRSHPRSKEIYSQLEKMTRELVVAGYSPDTTEVFLDIGEEDKESAVYRHSEKLAMAFGLLNSKAGVTIRIVKNLRMCVDCHGMAKLVSKVHQREVIVRDRTRFHHFRDGSCSCRDYW